MKSRIKQKNQKLPSSNKVIVEYTNGKQYTIPRAVDIIVEHGKRIKGETSSEKDGVNLTTQFVIDFTDVDTIEVIGKGDSPTTGMLIEKGVLSEVHNDIKSATNMHSVVRFVDEVQVTALIDNLQGGELWQTFKLVGLDHVHS